MAAVDSLHTADISRKWIQISLLGVFSLFILGLAFGHGYQFGQIQMQNEIHYALLLLLAVMTAVQAWRNGSLLLSVFLTLALPLGFWLGAGHVSFHEETLLSFVAFGLALTKALMFGLTGHFLGWIAANEP